MPLHLKVVIANFDAGGVAQDLVSKYLFKGVLSAQYIAFPMRSCMGAYFPKYTIFPGKAESDDDPQDEDFQETCINQPVLCSFFLLGMQNESKFESRQDSPRMDDAQQPAGDQGECSQDKP